jgi:hypothetical protein
MKRAREHRIALTKIKGKADKNNLIALYTEMWLDSETDDERAFTRGILLSLVGVPDPNKEKVVKGSVEREVNKHLGPIPERDPELDAIMKQIHGGAR